MDEQRKPDSKAEQEIEEMVFDQAFHITYGDHRELPKRILAVAYLLATCSGEGNQPVDGVIADGLEKVLRDIAKEVGMLARRLYEQEIESHRGEEG